MKSKLILIATILNGVILACNDQLFRLALNQRSFYNPAALCPYCKGSIFLSTGLSFIPGSQNGFGNYYAVGNDGPNGLSGPWDISYSAIRTPENHTDAYSFRYAYSVQANNWKIAAGFRESFYSIHEKIISENISMQKYSTKLFDTDLGVMATNQKGIYVGISVLHVLSPSKNLTNENGFSHTMKMDATMNVVGGYVQKINKVWDVLPDVSLLKSKTEMVVETGGMIRYKHHYAIGGGVTFSSDEKVDYEFRGGFMSSKFKWLVSAAPSAQGWNFETGIVFRILSTPCDGKPGRSGGTCDAGGGGIVKPKVKPKKQTDHDDFVRHR